MNLELPEFLVPCDSFDKGMRVEWRTGDRFRMSFGRRQFGARSGGSPAAPPPEGSQVSGGTH